MAAAQSFLEALGLGHHLAVFTQHGFTESSQIANISEADLDKMKITKKKERKAVLKEAKKIRALRVPSPAPATASAAAVVAGASAANNGAVGGASPGTKKRGNLKGKASTKQLAPHSLAGQQTDEVSDLRTDTTQSQTALSKAELDKIIARAREANASLSLLWKKVGKDADVDEFTDVTQLVQLTLTKLEEITNPTVLVYQKVHQFALDLEDFHKQVQAIGNSKKLSEHLNSSRRNPLRSISSMNASVSGNLKWLLMAAGTDTQVEAHLNEIQMLKNQSTMRIAGLEGQTFWEDHFHELDMDMVPWDRFIGAVQIFTGKALDIQSELMLKHILDNRNLSIVRPQDFSNFLKCFGPLSQAVNNVKAICSQKWFHGFLSMDEVIHHLSDQQPGTFLVRFPRSKGDSFALEYVEDRGKVRTVLVENDMPQGVFITEENDMKKKFTDVIQLVQHYSDTLKFPFHSDLLHKEWFQGDVSTVEADAMLAGRPPGTFMIRLETGSFQYACSYVAALPGGKGQVRHVFIKKVPSGYVIETQKTDKSDEAPVIYPSLQHFVKAWHGTLRYNWDAERVPSVTLADFCEKPGDAVTLKGPGTVDGQGKTFDFACKVAAQTVATYPQKTLGYDVVCDQYLIKILGNRIVFALADGCNWGARPREAAMRATESIIDQLGDKLVQQQIRDTLDCKHFLLRAFSVANEAILAGKDDPWLAGTTTLMAGIIAEIDEQANEFAVVLVSVGDCKCYVYRQEVEVASVVDVTEGNRRNLRDPRDCGGRLGPALDGALPDLRNLSSYFWPLKSNDVVFAVSDGVHDNLDPESLGSEPSELLDTLTQHNAPEALRKAVEKAKKWDLLEPKRIEELKTWSMCHSMAQILAKTKDRNALSFVQDLVKYAVNMTSANRTFMEQNPSLPEPSDHKRYPGKMDHTTAVGLTAGPLFPKDKMIRHRRHSPSLSDAAGQSAGGSSPSLAGSGSQPSLAKGKDSPDSKDKKTRKFGSKRDKEKEKESSKAKPGGGSPNSPAAGSAAKPTRAVEDLKEEASSHHRHRETLLSGVTSSEAGSYGGGASDAVSKYSTMNSKMRTSLSSLKKTGLFETLAPKFIASLPKADFLRPSVDLDYDKLHYGPTGAKDEEKSMGTMASGWSRSTLPFFTAEDGKRVQYNDPNTTHWSVAALPHRFLFATTAGGSWRQNAASHTASFHACSSFIQSLYSSRSELVSISQAGYVAMRALDSAQEEIMNVNTNVDEIGSAVLLGGVALRTSDTKWNVVLANVGNCKAYVWSHKSGEVRDMTPNNTTRDRADSNGKLGNADNGKPDTRNLALFHMEVDDGDFVILLSPGAYHNFDPELLGRSPFDLGLSTDPSLEWAKLADAETAKDKSRCEKIEEVLQEKTAKASGADLSRVITTTIGIYCMDLTKPTRTLMESNRSAREPTDHVKYPGKMGHVSVLTFRCCNAPKAEATRDSAAGPGSTSLLSTLFKPMQSPDK